jgi:hypothetical protein
MNNMGYVMILKSEPLSMSRIIDHTCCDLLRIPMSDIDNVRNNIHVAFGTTSHGTQIKVGVEAMDDFMALKPDYEAGDFAVDCYGDAESGELDVIANSSLHSLGRYDDMPFPNARDIGTRGDPIYIWTSPVTDYDAWYTDTIAYLDTSPNVNVVMWCWCGMASYCPDSEITNYLAHMEALEAAYPDVTFIYTTDHVNGAALGTTLYTHNQTIRDYCTTNNKWLYDFADIESYDPDWNYFGDKHLQDSTVYDYDDSGSASQTAEGGDGTPAQPIAPDRSWAIDWQDSHVLDEDWFEASINFWHTQHLNINLKSYAFWWMLARIAGWNGYGYVTNLTVQFDDTNKYYGDTDTSIVQNFPAIAGIVAKDDPDYPVYGLYTWSSDWASAPAHDDIIADIGFGNIRIAGMSSFNDEMMGNVAASSITPMAGLFTQYRENYLTGGYVDWTDTDADDEFIADYLTWIDTILGKYGPSGSYFDSHPDPYKPILEWEIWNEPNLHYLVGVTHWQYDDFGHEATIEVKADLYARLLIAAYNHIRTNSDWDDVKIVAFSACGVSHGGPAWISAVLTNLMEHGDSYDFFDILSWHPYTHDVGPDTEHVLPGYHYSVVNDQAEIQTLLTNAGLGSKPIWWTEVGWPRTTGVYEPLSYAVTERQQAAYAARLFIIALRLGVERCHVMFITDADNFNGGFINGSDEYYEQADVTKFMSSIMPHPKIVSAVSDGTNGYYAYYINPDVNDTLDNILAAWNVEEETDKIISITNDDYLVYDMFGKSRAVRVSNGQIRVHLGPCPIFIKKV